MNLITKAANKLRDPLYGAGFCIYVLFVLQCIEMVFRPRDREARVLLACTRASPSRKKHGL